MELAADVYRVTRHFPREEMFGLTRQVRSAAGSVPSNIAEGKGRQTKKDYVQFLYRARGSLFETMTQLEISRNVEYITDEVFEAIFARADEVSRVLNGLIKHIHEQIGRSS
jgi:four helix bundle protein